jgi:hypothetical protein
MTFGIGYAMVYHDRYGNKPIIVLKIIGKLAFAEIFIYSIVAYPFQVPRLFLILVIGDLTVVVLFSKLLAWTRGVGRPRESSPRVR